MNSTQKPFQSALPSDQVRLSHWALLRTQLVWAYDRRLEGTPKTWSYVPAPTAAWLIRHGQVTFHFPSGKETYTAGNWIFPRYAHGQQEFAKDTHILSLRFMAEWPTGKPLFNRNQTYSFPEQALPELTAAAQQLIHFTNQHFPNSWSQTQLTGTLEQYFLLQPSFYAWIVEYYRSLKAQGIPPITLGHLHEKVHLSLYHLENWPLNLPFHEQDLARKVGLSLSQFNKIFHKDIGSTPAAYWNERRLQAALTQLISGTQSIKTIAYESGFSSPANFTRWFRAHTGFTPTEYRSMNKQVLRV